MQKRGTPPASILRCSRVAHSAYLVRQVRDFAGLAAAPAALSSEGSRFAAKPALRRRRLRRREHINEGCELDSPLFGFDKNSGFTFGPNCGPIFGSVVCLLYTSDAADE